MMSPVEFETAHYASAPVRERRLTGGPLWMVSGVHTGRKAVEVAVPAYPSCGSGVQPSS